MIANNAIPIRACLICAVALACVGAGCGKPAADKPEAQAPSASTSPAAPAAIPAAPPIPKAASWPTYHGATTLAGFADIALPDALEVRWRASLGAEVSNTPVADGERIYAADIKGQVHAFDFDGKPLWSRAFVETMVEGRPPNEAAFDAPLALFDTTLIACSAGGTVFALDPATGEPRWEINTHLPLLGSPAFAVVQASAQPQRRLYLIDQSQGSLHALDFDTGKDVWKSEAIARCDGSPVANAEVAVFGSCAAALHFFSTVDGKLIREVDVGADCEIAGGIALVDGSVYSGSRCGKFVQVNARTGAIDWANTNCEGEALETPAVSDATVAFTANDGYVYALKRASGVLTWRAKVGHTPSSPVLTQNKLLVAVRGQLFMLALDDGRTVWSYEVSDEITSPALAGNLIVVGCDDGSVVAFGPKGS